MDQRLPLANYDGLSVFATQGSRPFFGMHVIENEAKHK